MDRYLEFVAGRGRPNTLRAAATDRVSVLLKGPRRGLSLLAEGLDEILAAARRRAGLEHPTCHQLRHTCLTRLGGRMALEAVRAQAGAAVADLREVLEALIAEFGTPVPVHHGRDVARGTLRGSSPTPV